MTINYYIEKEAREGYKWNDGFYSYGFESNKKRAIEGANQLAQKEKRKVRVKTWGGKVIFETNYNGTR